MSKIIYLPQLRLAPILLSHHEGLTKAFLNGRHKGDEAPKLAADAQSHWKNFGFGLYTIFSDRAQVMGYTGAQHWSAEEAYEGVLKFDAYFTSSDDTLRQAVSEIALNQAFMHSGGQTHIVQATYGEHSNLDRETIEKMGMTIAPLLIRHRGHEQPHASIIRDTYIYQRNIT